MSTIIAPIDISAGELCRNIKVDGIGDISNQQESDCVETRVLRRECDDARPWHDSLPLMDASIFEHSGLDDRFLALWLIDEYKEVKDCIYHR